MLSNSILSVPLTQFVLTCKITENCLITPMVCAVISDPNGPGERNGTILTTIGWGYIQPVDPAGQVSGASGTATTAPPMSGPSSASSGTSSFNSSDTTGTGKSLIGGTGYATVWIHRGICNFSIDRHNLWISNTFWVVLF